MNQQQAARYVAKHAFQGNVAQSQLSFPAGAIIIARPNQDGAWWWGSCNGREGWFPPTYVGPAQGGAPIIASGTAAGIGGMPGAMRQSMQQQQPVSMISQGQTQQPVQQLMQQATFTSSVQQQQIRRQQQQGPLTGSFTGQMSVGPPQNAFGVGTPNPRQAMSQSLNYGTSGPTAFGAVQQQRPPTAAFGVPGIQQTNRQMHYEPADPFAGLDATPSVAATGSLASSLPVVSSNNVTVSPAQQPQQSTATGSNGISPSAKIPPRSISGSTSKESDSAAAALARLGISPSSSADQATSPNNRSASPAVSVSQSISRTASGAASAGSLKSSMSTSSAIVDTPSANPSAVIQSATAGQAPRQSKQETKEEMQLRLAREQEESRLKAQMRQEREQLKRADGTNHESNVGGLGTSGVATTSPTVGGGQSMSIDDGDSIYFNPYDFLSGTSGSLPDRKYSPIYRVPPFWALLNLTSYVQQKPVPKEKLQDRVAMYEQLAKALSFVSHVCADTEKRAKQRGGKRTNLHYLRHNHYACESCIKLISLLPHSAGASGSTLDGLFLNFINVFVELISKVQPGQQLVLPGGWQQPDYTYLCLYIIRCHGQNRWSFTVCNTGKDGLQYHPASFDAETGTELKQLAMTVWGTLSLCSIFSLKVHVAKFLLLLIQTFLQRVLRTPPFGFYFSACRCIRHARTMLHFCILS
jgi:SH3 domain